MAKNISDKSCMVRRKPHNLDLKGKVMWRSNWNFPMETPPFQSEIGKRGKFNDQIWPWYWPLSSNVSVLKTIQEKCLKPKMSGSEGVTFWWPWSWSQGQSHLKVKSKFSNGYPCFSTRNWKEGKFTFEINFDYDLEVVHFYFPRLLSQKLRKMFQTRGWGFEKVL